MGFLAFAANKVKQPKQPKKLKFKGKARLLVYTDNPYWVDMPWAEAQAVLGTEGLHWTSEWPWSISLSVFGGIIGAVFAFVVLPSALRQSWHGTLLLSVSVVLCSFLAGYLIGRLMEKGASFPYYLLRASWESKENRLVVEPMGWEDGQYEISKAEQDALNEAENAQTSMAGGHNSQEGGKAPARPRPKQPPTLQATSKELYHQLLAGEWRSFFSGGESKWSKLAKISLAGIALGFMALAVFAWMLFKQGNGAAQ